MIPLLKWAPAAVFGLGSFLVHGLGPQQVMELRQPLEDAVPATLAGYDSTVDVQVSEEEVRVAGFTDYLLRNYVDPEDEAAYVSTYVGFYASQTQGQTIHSPKNCLPGSGWEPLANQVAEVSATDGTTYRVNRYILQREDERALVLYWYQGRGRVENNEYVVKWDLLRDSALRQRSDEALVRVVVPVRTTEDEAFETARRTARELIPAVDLAMPE